MPDIAFGMNAYKRDYAGAPEIQLLNRFPEASPTNLRDQSSLLARPGTNLLGSQGAGQSTSNVTRKTYSKQGLFNNDLFLVSGEDLFRVPSDGSGSIQITGIIGSGIPKFAWDVGPGYEHLFVSDGELLQVYSGGSQGTAALTFSGSITDQVIEIGGTYYGWNGAVDTGTPAGTAANPWLCLPTGDPLQNMANMIDFIGTPGVDFSTALRGANTEVIATVTGGPPATAMTVTSISGLVSANDITTTVYSGGVVSWSSATLVGAGVQTLEGVYIPTGEPINGLCTLDHYVMASVAGSNKMFFIEPGAVIVQTLDFFSKESNPDPILDLLTWGDTFVAAGSGSIETWYATGDLNAPFAPIEGRTVTRGIVDGTLVLVQDQPIFVGADGIVYSFAGGTLTRISNHGIEERIREQLRHEAGVT